MHRPGTSDKKLRRTLGAASLPPLLAATILLAFPIQQAEGFPGPPAVERPDTIKTATPRLFQNRALFSTGYLGRALETAQRRDAAYLVLPPQTVTAPNLEAEHQHDVFARRYRISPDLARTIIESAVAEGIDPELGFRLVRVESLFRVNARGPGGSLGLTQLMPSTARTVDRSLRSESDILDPENNLRVGFRYLRRMIDRYDGDVRLGLLAYNRGSQAVDRALQAGRDPENGYSPKVLGTSGTRYRGTGLVQQER
jgi:soluble lytic murein transglycosylase-like protein